MSDLQDLILVHDHTQGFLGQVCDPGMQGLHGHTAALAVDVVVYHAGLQRPRTIKGDQRNDFFECARLQLDDQFRHARGLDLEHPFGVAGAEHVVGFLVVERDGIDIEVFEARLALDHLLRVGHQGQGFEAEEVKFDQADFFDAAHVVLGHHDAGFLVLVERNHLDQGRIADHDPGRVF